MNGSDKEKEEKSHDLKESKNMGVVGNVGGKSKSVYEILGALSFEEVQKYYEERQQVNIKLNEEDKSFLHEDTPQISGVMIQKHTPQPISPQNKNKNKNNNENVKNTVQYNTNIHNTKVYLSAHDNVLRTPQENKRLRRKRNKQNRKLKMQQLTAQNEAQQMLNDLDITTSGTTTSTVIFPGKPTAMQTSIMHANKQNVQHVHVSQPPISQPANNANDSLTFKFGTPSKQMVSIESNIRDIIRDTLENNGSLDAFEKALPEDDILHSIYQLAKKKVKDELSNLNVEEKGNTENRNLDAFYRHNKDRGRSSDIYIPQTKRIRKSRSVGNYSNSDYSSSNTTSTPLSFVSGTASRHGHSSRSNLIDAIGDYNKYYRSSDLIRNRRRSVPYTRLPLGGNNPDLRNVSDNNNRNYFNPRNGHAHSAGANVHGRQPAGNGNSNGNVPGQGGNGNGGNNGGSGNGNGNHNNGNGSSDGDRTPDDNANGQPPGAGNQRQRGQPQGQPQSKPTFREKLDFEKQRLYLKKTVDKQLIVQGEPFYANSNTIYKINYNALKTFIYFDSYIRKSEKEGMDQIQHKDVLLGELKKKLKGKAFEAYSAKVLTLPNQDFDTIKDFFWWFAGEYEFDEMLPGMYKMLTDWTIEDPNKWTKMIEPYEKQYDLLLLCEEYTNPLIANKLENKLPDPNKRESWHVENMERALRKHKAQFEVYIKYCESEKKEPHTLDELHEVFSGIKKRSLSRKLKRTDDLDYISGRTKRSKDPPFGKSANIAQRGNYPRGGSVPRGRGRGKYRGNYNNRRGGSQRRGSRGRGRGRGQGYNQGNRGNRGNRGRGRGRNRGGYYYGRRYANQSRRSRRNNSNSRDGYNSDSSYSPRPLTQEEKMRKYPCSICHKFGHWSYSCTSKSKIAKLKKQVNSLQKSKNSLDKNNKRLKRDLNKIKSNSNNNKNKDSSNDNSGSHTVATIQQQSDNHNKKRGKKKRGGKNRGRGRGKQQFHTSSFARSAAPAELEAQAENDRYKERYDEYGNQLASS